MKTTTRTTWLALAGLTLGLALPVSAQDEGQRRPQRPGAGAGGGGEASGGAALLVALDRNGDGKLQQNEIDMAVVALRRLDRDKNGEVGADEMVAARRRPGGPGSDRAPGGPGGRRPGLPDFSAMDSDGDGKISKEEAPEQMRERFDRMDPNGDGFLDKKEQEQVLNFIRQRMRDGRGQRPPGQQGRPGPGGRPRPDDGQGGAEKPKRPDSTGGEEK